jgi:hypothetical protein
LICLKEAMADTSYKITMVDAAAEALRQRIEHYRRLLAQGIAADQARVYLELIARDHAALRALESKVPASGDVRRQPTK